MEESSLVGKFKLVVGMEIHLHLKTENKMFCWCSADIWEKEPNTITCPTCLGLPGALPVANKEAVEKALRIGLALNCSINKISKFDRKHYFYPDLPKGYQISQYKQPLCFDGELLLDSGSVAEIERVHLEEDVAKSIHQDGKTLIDFNKSGIPLVEIVTKPCFTNINDVVDYCKKIQNIVWYLGVGEVDMEKGQMRLEVNISLRTQEMQDKNQLMPYKVEVKNINSFKFMEKAIVFEIKRQKEILEKGGMPLQENRGFIESSLSTVGQRSKEEARDYRYFPEPDIPPMEFSDDYINDLKSGRSSLPADIFKHLTTDYNIPSNIAKVLVNNLGPKYVEKLEATVKLGADPVKVASNLCNKPDLRDKTENELLQMTKAPEYSLDEKEITEVIEKLIKENQKAVEDYKNGKGNALQFLLGSAMRDTKGRFSPEFIKQKLLEKLS